MATAFDYSFNEPILEGLPDDVQNSIRRILQEAAQVRADTTDPLSSRAASQRSQAELLENQAARILMANRPDLKNITGGEDKDAIAQRKFNNPFYYALDENQKAAVDKEFEAASEKVRLPRALQGLGIRYPAAAPQVFSSAEAAPEVAPVAAPVAEAVSAPVVAPAQRSVQPSIAGLLVPDAAPAAPAAPAARRSQSIEGLLGSLFGGNELEDLMTPQQRAAINQRGLLAAAAALLQAGGPSTRRVSLGQALGSALEAGQTGAERAQQSALTQMLTRQKLEEAKRSRDLQANIAKLLTGGSAPASAGGEITAGEALAAPGMAAGPTVARAAMIGKPRPAAPAMSENELKASQYRQIADVYAASGKGEDAKRFMDIAENLAPTRQEVVGEPIQTATGWIQRTKTGGFIPLPKDFEPAVKVKPIGEPLIVTDKNSGNQILVQRYDDSTIKPLEGFGPKRDLVLETVDGRVVAIDKATVAPGTTFGTGISPVDQARLDIEKQRLDMERRRLGISEAEFARNAYERVDTAQGIVYVPKRPGAPIIPITDATGKPLMGVSGGKATEGELNAAGFALRMERAGGIISTLPESARAGIASSAVGTIPFVGGVGQRIVQSPEQQQYKQAADDWIRAKLRKESGAVIGKDEMDQEYITYFPQVGDSAAVVAQKAEARRVATEAMRTSAGRAYQPYTPPPPSAAPKEGDTSKDKNGRNIVFRNNRWEYK